jgi:UPF0755 protein
MIRDFIRWVLLCTFGVVVVMGLLIGLALRWPLQTQMLQPQTSSTPSQNDVHVSSGRGAKAIALELQAQGLDVQPILFVVAVHLQQVAHRLKAGRYELPSKLDTWDLVRLLSEGNGALNSFVIVEGQSSALVLQRLRAEAKLKDDWPGLSADHIAQTLRLPGGHLEGWLYPDTYKYAPGSPLSAFVKRAVRLQQQALDSIWLQRDRQLPLKTPYEALVLASIVEKETGLAQDRAKIASVFVNRLRLGMLLQTDPTVIYGLGAQFDGNLTRLHLKTDTLYNTYTRPGLPPTPIANPGRAALLAATRPERTAYYYFVAKGNGASVFSQNLTDHNQAVRRYQLGR